MVHIMKEKCIGIMICFLLTAIVLPVSGSESYGQYGGVNSIINAGDKLMEPPSIPIVSGPVVAGPGISLNFSCVSKTSNETKLYYLQDNESDWSEPHNISIASQITFSNIQLGYVYLNIFPENNPYGHSNLLELFGAIIMVSREYDLVLNATVTEAVHYVVFEAINILRGDNTSCDDTNVSNGVSGVLTISRGLWQLSAYAYDENETLIDYDRIEFFLYLVFGSGGSSVEYIDMIRQRLLDRILA
jgi:hypothetical protein